jgi:hypothetical protein
MKLKFKNYTITIGNILLSILLFYIIQNLDISNIFTILLFITLIFIITLEKRHNRRIILSFIVILRIIIRLGWELFHNNSIYLTNSELLIYIALNFLILYFIMNDLLNYHSFFYAIKKSINYFIITFMLLIALDNLIHVYNYNIFDSNLVALIILYYILASLSLKTNIEVLKYISKIETLGTNYYFNILFFHLLNPFIFFFMFSINKSGRFIILNHLNTINFLDLIFITMFFVYNIVEGGVYDKIN